MIDTVRVAKLIKMLSSNNDCEVLSAARLLTKMGIHEVADTMIAAASTPNPQPQDGLFRCYAHIDATHVELIADCYRTAFPEVPDLSLKQYRFITNAVTALGGYEVMMAMRDACEKMPVDTAFSYFRGVCRRKIKEKR